MAMPHPNPPPRPPRRSRQDQIAYGLCILLIWLMALAAVLDG
ncbi:hypothetical protein [uncultured Brevundimonas sp.]|nr:hypothetical protein [uncultured Brevundimonas sp.]